MILVQTFSSDKHLQMIANVMSIKSMKEIEKQVIGDVFTYVKLEEQMPKLVDRNEIQSYFAPTMVIAGKNDIFFPAHIVIKRAKATISNVITKQYDMGHFPSDEVLKIMNVDINQFLQLHY